VILVPSPPPPGSAADRLSRALAARGHAEAGPATLFVCPAPGQAVPDPSDWLRAAPGAAAGPAPARLLVVTRLGTHPDAVSPRLRECWALEERARSLGQPVLVLRLGPLLGPGSPLWLHLGTGPALPRGGTKLVNPVAEADVVETLERALAGRVAWEGWYELAGPETWSLAELVELARAAGAPRGGPGAAWEPPLAEIEEHRLAEAGPWLAHFGMTPPPLAERARAWAVAAGSAT
jgi:uncharacterized protein YbjT (DUF2867 family)